MIIKTNPGRPRYLSRVLALPLLLLLAAAIATHATPRQNTGSPYLPFLRFFNHHLRYPEGALDAGLQSTVWVFIHVDAQGRMTSLTSSDAEAVKKHKGQSIRVTSRPAAGKSIQPPSADMNGPFLEAVQKAAESIGKDKSETYPAGDFYFSIAFNIEKP